MARFSGMQYCKTDLIATKGIVFVKYAKSSSACLAMETIQETGMVRSPGHARGGWERGVISTRRGLAACSVQFAFVCAPCLAASC